MGQLIICSNTHPINHEYLAKLGFVENNKIVNGFRPHYICGNDILFIIGSNYSAKRIFAIEKAFKDYKGNVYGIYTFKAPRLAIRDWLSTENLTLIRVSEYKSYTWKRFGENVRCVIYRYPQNS